MDINNPPRSFGVFKPVDHTVVTFADPAALESAANALLAQGFFSEDLTRYSPAQMLAQSESDLQTASPLASMGQELNLVKAYRDLAQQGCSFLVVHAPDDLQIETLTQVAKAVGAQAAQRFGSFIIEELIAPSEDEVQTSESPAKGLDLDTDGLDKP